MGKERGRMIWCGVGLVWEHFQAVSAGLLCTDDGQDATLADQLMGKDMGRMNSSRGSLYDT